MLSTAEKKEIITNVISNVWGAPATADLMDPEFTIEFRNAPPGMPQIFDPFDVSLLYDWLGRTVKSLQVNIEELFATTQEDLFFAVGTMSAKVFWGLQDGDFESKFLYKIQLKDGKVYHCKMMMDTLAFLKAAGREIPPFYIDYTNDVCVKYAAENPEEPIPDDPTLDSSDAAVQARIQQTLLSFTGVGEAIYAPDHGGPVWFLPYTMRIDFKEEELPLVGAWTMLSCPPPWVCDPNAKFYQTEDPLVVFAETGLICKPSRWVGNNVEGSYHNRYFYILRFDKLGRLQCMEEYLNPVNKYNSINVSLPTFPYYL